MIRAITEGSRPPGTLWNLPKGRVVDLAPLVRAIEVLMSPLEWGSQEDWLAECLRGVRSATGAAGPPVAGDVLQELQRSLALPDDHPAWLRAALDFAPAERRSGLPPLADVPQDLLPLITLRCALAAGLSSLGPTPTGRGAPVPSLPCTREIRRSFGLRGREPQVALLAAAGLSNAEIARDLGLSPHTVRHYLERVMDRLGLHSRKALALHFLAGAPAAPGTAADGVPSVGRLHVLSSCPPNATSWTYGTPPSPTP
jgi:DNA-binding CsgD family transcriptional regulator